MQKRIAHYRLSLISLIVQGGIQTPDPRLRSVAKISIYLGSLAFIYAYQSIYASIVTLFFILGVSVHHILFH